MTQVNELNFKVDLSGADSAIDMLNKLAEAAKRAEAAIESLNGAAHGGINIEIVGDIANVVITPASAEGRD